MYYWVTTPELGDDEREALGLDQGFDDQGSAEQWLTAMYLDLEAGGVDEVALYDEGRIVYGPMSLQP